MVISEDLNDVGKQVDDLLDHFGFKVKVLLLDECLNVLKERLCNFSTVRILSSLTFLSNTVHHIHEAVTELLSELGVVFFIFFIIALLQ